jgi:hypothetical protein
MRGLIVSMALAACACAPAPRPMAATEASEILAQFAAGAAPVDICAPQGRALLRGAVRAYGAEMQRAGVAWPASPALGVDPDDMGSVDAAVLTASWAGLIEPSDLRGPARRLSFDDWPELRGLRHAGRVACAEAARLQQAAARFVLEAERYQAVAERAARDPAAAERVDRQALRLQRAQAQMRMAAAGLETEVAARDS